MVLLECDCYISSCSGSPDKRCSCLSQDNEKVRQYDDETRRFRPRSRRCETSETRTRASKTRHAMNKPSREEEGEKGKKLLGTELDDVGRWLSWFVFSPQQQPSRLK